MNVSNFKLFLSLTDEYVVKPLNIILTDPCLSSIDQITGTLKNCCDVKHLVQKSNGTWDFDILNLYENIPILFGKGDAFIVICNARVIEIYLNEQYESSIKGLKLCENCIKNIDVTDFVYFYIVKRESINDKIEIKLRGLVESRAACLYNVWSLSSDKIEGTNKLYEMNNSSNINWSNVERMLQNSNNESVLNPAVVNLLQSVKKQSQLTNAVSSVRSDSNNDIQLKLDNITIQLNRLETKVDAIYNHLFHNCDN